MVKASEAAPPKSVRRNKRAKGRSLTDFGKLSMAEKKVIRACATGVTAAISTSCPEEANNQNTVRGDLLRFLALGGDELAPVHELGVLLEGAWVTGVLDLTGTKTATRLAFWSCYFESNLFLQDSEISGLYLFNCTAKSVFADRTLCRGSIYIKRKSRIKSLRIGGASIAGDLDCSSSLFAKDDEGSSIIGDGARVNGDLFLREGFTAEGIVRFTGSRIGGDISCEEGIFLDKGGLSLNISRVEVGGGIYLVGPFRCHGCVDISGAQVNGDVNCQGGQFKSETDLGLYAYRSRIEGNVFLNDEFIAAKTCDFSGAEVGGSLDCSSATFASQGDAFRGTGLLVSGAFTWRDIRETRGTLRLDAAHVGTLSDDWQSYSKLDQLVLNGFRYDRIGLGPADAVVRGKWLQLQHPERHGDVFWSQPWEHLIKLFREMGHIEDAKLLAIKKQKELLRLKVIGGRQPTASGSWPWRQIEKAKIWLSNRGARLLHRLYGLGAGFGYRPMRTVVAMAIAWALAAGVYSWGEARGLFGPTAPILLTNPAYSKCGQWNEGQGARWTRCDRLPDAYSTFDAPMYSLDVILPLVDLKQEGDWAPIVGRSNDWSKWAGFLVRGVMWIEILFGWIMSLLLVSALGRLVQKD